MLLSLFSPRPRITFAQITEQWLDEAARRCRPAYVQEARRLFGRDLIALAPLRADRITKRDIANVLERIGAAGTANLAHAVVSSALGWAISTGRLPDTPNPAHGLRKRALPPRERVLLLQELASIWRACDGLGTYGAIVRLLIATGCRRSEIGALLWGEVDLAGHRLHLPAARMKGGRPHIVPLTDLAIACLPPRRGEGFPNVFGTLPGRPFSGWSKSKCALDRRVPGVREWRLHDIRRGVASGIADLGVSDDVVERILAHAPMGVTRRHYNLATRLGQQRDALRAWADAIRAAARAASTLADCADDPHF